MKLGIKYMVSLRCKMVVKVALDDLGLHYRSIDLGEAELVENKMSAEQHDRLKNVLLRSGLELLEDKRAILIQNIKELVDELIYHSEELPQTNISTYLSDKLDHDYAYLAKIFSEATGTTISHYILTQKIEKAKELILYEDLNLTEISFRLHYSSLAHMSTQFKQITGLTPTYFKNHADTKKRVMFETV